jgi:multicomponent Na+:H+ antiporter subunit F
VDTPSLASSVALVMLALAVILAFARLVQGPTLPDRVVAIDLFGVLIVCLLVVIAANTGEASFLDAAIVLAMVSFVGTVAYARYVEREP